MTCVKGSPYTMFYTCFPFLYKPKVSSHAPYAPYGPYPSIPFDAPAPSSPFDTPFSSFETSLDPAASTPYNTSDFKQVPLIDEDPRGDVSPRQLRIPDALMNILNPRIKIQLKKFCRDNNLCVACSYANPDNPTILILNQLVYECPNCDSDVEFT